MNNNQLQGISLTTTLSRERAADSVTNLLETVEQGGHCIVMCK